MPTTKVRDFDTLIPRRGNISFENVYILRVSERFVNYSKRTMKSQDKNIVKTQVKSSIEHRIGSDAFSAYAEIIDALAYACTFKNPRMFADMEMNDRTWQDFALSITTAELHTVSQSLNYNPKNRLFYILGCLTRVYSRRKSSISKQDYAQRRYTKAELERHITKVEDLANIEW